MGEGSFMTENVESKPMPAPESYTPPVIERQWVSAPQSSCDVRVGEGLTTVVGTLLKSAVGSPHLCVLLCGLTVPQTLTQELTRQLSDGGFTPAHIDLASLGVQEPGEACSLTMLTKLSDKLAQLGTTKDDLILAVGTTPELTLAIHLAQLWCGGTNLAIMPLDLEALVCTPVTAAPLNTQALARALDTHGHAQFVLVDPLQMDLDPTSKASKTAFVYMVSSAVAENEKSFAALWDRAQDLVAGDTQTLITQAIDTLKSRGHIVSSTALAITQSIAYGEQFARALTSLDAQVDPAVACAEGLRFAARLSVAQEKFEIDDMFAQDDLLEMLGIDVYKGTLSAEALAQALKKDSFTWSRKFMMLLPMALGRVRLSNISDELLHEHCEAWTQAHN